MAISSKARSIGLSALTGGKGGTVQTSTGGVSVAPSTSPVTRRASGGGGGGGGQGYSYVEPTTGVGYEVSPTGEKKEVVPLKAGTYVDPVTGRKYEVSPRGIKTEIKSTSNLKLGIISPNIAQKSTRTDLSPQKQNIPIYTQPYLMEVPTGSFKTGSEFQYKEVPTSKIVYVDPTGYGVQKERAPTREELAYYREQTSVLEASTKKAPLFFPSIGGLTGLYEQAETTIRRTFTEPVIGGFYKVVNYEPGKTDLGITTRYLESKGVPSGIAKTGEFIAGSGIGIIEDIRTNPVKHVALLGVGYGLGYASEGVIAGTSVIPKVGRFLGPLTKVGLFTAGGIATVNYASEVGKKIYISKTPAEAGSVFGVALKDISLAGYGSSMGAKGFQQTRGIISTWGREEIITPQGDFPTASTKKQLELFQKNINEQLGIKPGAYHTTSQKFWRETIKPEPGSSELPGLYASTKISKPFAKISGSSKFNVEGFIKNILTPTGKPGVAYLQPKGFRYSPVIKIKDGSFPYGFIKPAKRGFADIPGLKTEIEAVFRPEAGNYIFQSGKYYTKINGVRVPIDTFIYDTGTTIKASIMSSKGIGLIGGSSSYSIPSIIYMPSLISPKITDKTGSSSYSIPSTIYMPSLISPKITDKTGSYSNKIISTIKSTIVKSKSSKVSKSLRGSYKPLKSSNINLLTKINTYKYSKSSTPSYPPYYYSYQRKPQKAYGYAYPTRTTKTKGRKIAYQSSLASYQLGIYAKKGYKTNRKYSGLEIRPMLKKVKEKDLSKALFGKRTKQKNKKNYSIKYKPITYSFNNNYNPKLNKLLIGGF